MKLKELIKKLQALENEHKDNAVVVDFDHNGYFNLDDVEVVEDEDNDSAHYINLKSSNQ